MDDKKTRLPWRCQNRQQASDKAKIYNSREWKELKARKKSVNRFCEMCIAEGQAKGIKRGYLTPVQCVHHIIPIETAHNMAEMRKLAFDWTNLMSLCNKHHNQVHNQKGYHTTEAVKQREADRHERWRDRMIARFTTQGQRAESEASTENPAHPF